MQLRRRQEEYAGLLVPKIFLCFLNDDSYFSCCFRGGDEGDDWFSTKKTSWTVKSKKKEREKSKMCFLRKGRRSKVDLLNTFFSQPERDFFPVKRDVEDREEDEEDKKTL